MMYQKGVFGYTSIADLDAHVLQLPYGHENRLSMIIMLPKRGVTLLSMLQRLQNVGLTRINQELERAKSEYDDDEVEVYLPRLSTRADFVLNTVLQDMGLLDIFDAKNANLERISKHSYLSRIVHKAQIDLNEEGTVASAATSKHYTVSFHHIYFY